MAASVRGGAGDSSSTTASRHFVSMGDTRMRHGIKAAALASAAALLLAGCGSTGGSSSSSSGDGSKVTSEGRSSKWFNQEEYDRQLATASKTPEGPADQPWLQRVDSPTSDTSKYKKAGPYN